MTPRIVYAGVIQVFGKPVELVMGAREERTAKVERIVLQRLASLQRAGVEQIGKAKATPVNNRSQAEASTPRRVAPDEQPAALAVIQDEVTACTRCNELARTRRQTVFGVGNPQARLCFLGEAPGADEDRQGQPFVGRAGQLLTDIIQKAMGLRRSDVYILNVLKCRPPGNRTPAADEVSNCRGYFERQLEAIKPEFICCLGSVAAHALLETTQTVGRLRGRFYDYHDAKVIVTYHPSYLLRTPSAKKETWEDVQMLMREMGLPIPER